MAKTLDYEYAVRDRAGKMVRGKLEAESPAVVANRLKSMGYAPVSITQANAGLKRELSIPGFGNKVGLKDLVDHVPAVRDHGELGAVAAPVADHPGGADRVQAAGEGARPGPQRGRGRPGAQ